MWTNAQGQYVYQRKPRICKHCGSRAIATYYFGYPNEEIVMQTKKDSNIKLGGCCLEEGKYVKAWCCNDCDTDFYKVNEVWLEDDYE